MDACLQCGSETGHGGKFCRECGAPLDGIAEHRKAGPGTGRRGLPFAWIGATVGAFVLGGALATTFLVPSHKDLAPRSQAPTALPKTVAMAMPPGHLGQHLPSGHPRIPEASRVSAVVAEAEKQAKANPKDVEVWKRFGDLAMHSAMLDPSNYQKAREAYAHVLELDPENAEALRGIGDVYFDQRQYEQAIAAYQHYLSRDPNDAHALTDLGTMYLSEHNSREAIKQYNKALALKPDFFPAQFNLAVAYVLLNDNAHAQEALDRARTLAPSATARTKIDQMIAQLRSPTVAQDAKR